MLSVTNEGRHHLALDFLEEIGPQASAAIPAVLQMLDNPSETNRDDVAHALVSITDEPQKIIPPLLKLLSDTNQDVHESIALAMYAWNTTGRDAGPALLRLAQDTNNKARIPATIALGKVAPDMATNILYELKQIALTNKTWHSDRAGEALASMGILAQPVVDELLAQAMSTKQDEDCGLAKAVIAIDPVKGGKLVPVLLEHLSKYPYEKRMALEALSSLGKSAESALPAIKPLLSDHIREVRTAATNALHSITSAPSALSIRAAPP